MADSPDTPQRARRGLVWILIATAVAGVAGYVVTWLIYRDLGSGDYEQVAVFWSAFFLLVGGLAGVQQEYSRATRPVDASVAGPENRRARASVFAIVTAGVVMVLVLALTPVWMPRVFVGDWTQWSWPLGVGIAASILMSATAGTLYGVASWGVIAGMIAVDGLLRIAAIGAALSLNLSISSFAWLIILPIPLTLGIFSFAIRRRVFRKSLLDVGYRRLSWNVTRTVVASVCVGVLVSGIPVVIGATSPDVSPALLGDIIFAVTLSRAPLIVIIMARQSYMVVQFRNHSERRWRWLGSISGLVAVATAIASVVAFFFGQMVLNWVAGRDLGVDGFFVALLMISAGLVGLLQVTGAFLLAQSRHSTYVVGLILAAASTVGLLLLPGDVVTRVAWALVAAPAIGLVTHILGMAYERRKLRA